MEFQKLIIFSFFFLFSLLITGLQVVQGSSHHHHHHHHHHQHGFRPTKLFVFGDSYADTGNNRKTQASSWKVPYGMTYPGKPSGRYSDGGVLTDFMAKYLEIKSPLPFRSTWRKFGGKRLRCGMNFAFGGTGVFKTAVLDPTMTRQLDLFEMLIKKSLYTKRDLQCSLALVTLSGNDYSYLLSQKNVSNDDVLNFIPKVVNQLELNLKRVHGMGVKRVAVAALQPLGCLPRVTMGTSYKECDGLDNFAVGLHNDYLTEAVERLNNQTKDSPFVILDLYDSFYTIIQNKTDNTGTMKFETPLKPCCMGINNETYCGDHDEKGVKQYTVCDNPKSTFFWDTAHPTHAGWHAVFSTLLATQKIF